MTSRASKRIEVLIAAGGTPEGVILDQGSSWAPPELAGIFRSSACEEVALLGQAEIPKGLRDLGCVGPMAPGIAASMLERNA